MNDGYLKTLQAISSSTPTPGGGAVAALSLAHAISLARMVARLTEGKEKWLTGHQAANTLLEKTDGQLELTLELARLDCEAFDRVMESYRLPKSTSSEIESRRQSIHLANLGATESPFRIISEALDFMRLLPPLADTCNSYAITDLGAASIMAHSAIRIGALNVQINLGSIGNRATQFQIDTQNMCTEADGIADRLASVVSNRM